MVQRNDGKIDYFQNFGEINEAYKKMKVLQDYRQWASFFKMFAQDGQNCFCLRLMHALWLTADNHISHRGLVVKSTRADARV
ncbi:hypothetical protein M8C21_008850, partial [Ambrosia artemisiifolia]